MKEAVHVLNSRLATIEQAIIFVYDVTNRESFENIKDWQHLVNKAFEHKKKPRCVLVANKGSFAYAMFLYQSLDKFISHFRLF